MTALGVEVRRARTMLGLSQKDLAEKATAAGWPSDTSAISRVESGERVLRVDEAAVVVRLLGLSLDVALGIQAPAAGYSEGFEAGYRQAMADVRALTEAHH
jgi:transcriptional regulator with XRE-family HTH domain